ncbi:DNA-binding MarR family transcriptional regulator [Pedobacter psychrotolerans]|uniref:HTH-type transcriptional regulator SarZ n=1 Tax=Pedobacter psychrotolerans TaxID=1843235 RepID=A0A4R2H7T9_9SPHI|nr:MarR family transcriptional regulator [Pedobacter psychrotolerans]TCO22543.1 DNA-binding MarR family transcriptional regulator [Pedobacter psychrotolerans]GGE65358.1 organic hydroperoxide resistance transcriptional regulator [Pedobacter psychrotolerans]
MNNLLKLENQVCFPVYAFSRELTQLYRPFLDDLGLTYPQYLVMLILWEENQQTVNQLGEKLYLDSGTLTPLLKRMEQKGIINRTRSTADERVVIISVTEIGEKMKEKATCIPAKLVEALGLSIDDLNQLKQIVTKALKR